MGDGDPGEVSPDGRWYWDGHEWQSTLSPDGKSRWNGTSWASVGARAARRRWSTTQIAAVSAGAFAAIVIAIVLVATIVGNAATGQSSQRQVAQVNSSTPHAASNGDVPKPASPSPSATPPASPSPSAHASPSSSPSSVAAPKPTPVASPKPPPPPPPPPTTCGAPSNPWGYNFCGGSLITSTPSAFCSYFPCISNFGNGVGYVVECSDGKYSRSGGRPGACSYHGGVYRPLYS